MNVLSRTSVFAFMIIFTVGFAPYLTQEAFAEFAVEQVVTVCETNAGTDTMAH